MFSKLFIYSCLIICIFSGCKKDDVEISPEPVISFVSISPSDAHQYSDHLILTFTYEDGNGDLGENTDEVKNCFVADNRLGITSGFRINQLSPEAVAIKGKINLDIGGQILSDSSAQQSVTFILYVVDRAGRVSNRITTSPVILHR